MSTKLQQAVLRDILNIALRNGPGKPVPPQDELARELRCSRTIVRESMAILEFLGIIDVKPKVGTVVADEKKWLVIDDEISHMVNEAHRVILVLRDGYKGKQNADEETAQAV